MKCTTSSCVHVHVLVLIGLRWEWDVNVVFSVYCRVLPRALRRVVRMIINLDLGEHVNRLLGNSHFRLLCDLSMCLVLVLIVYY